MVLTRTNWLKALREDILERQTLYPDGTGIVGRITNANWLKLLRNDQVKNQRLYPSADQGHVGVITRANFLRRFLQDIEERGSLWPEGGLGGLTRAIQRATQLMTTTLISPDGADVLNTQWWTTQAIRDIFQLAINTAQAVVNIPDQDDEIYSDAMVILNAAITVFTNARQRGSMVPALPTWELTHSFPSQVTMNRVIIPLNLFTGFTPQHLIDMDTYGIGVYNPDYTPTGRVKLLVQYVLSPPDDWNEVAFDDTHPYRPLNRLIGWEWETPNIRITGDNSTGQPIALRLVMGD